MAIYRVPSTPSAEPAASPPQPDVARLRDLARRHKIYWVTAPTHLRNRQGEVVKVGFELYLMGTHDHPEHPPTAGCRECVKVYRHIRALARSILPTDRRDSYYWISHFDSALSYPQFGGRADVVVRIKILHRKGFDQPIDDCQKRCLREMERNLEKLGAQKGRWRGSRV